MKLEEAIAKAKILNDSLKELTDEYEGQGSFIAAGMAVSFKLVGAEMNITTTMR